MAKHPPRTQFPLYQSLLYSPGTCSTLHTSAAKSPQDAEGTQGPRRCTRADPCRWLSIMARPGWRWEDRCGHIVPRSRWDVRIKRQLDNTMQDESQGGELQ